MTEWATVTERARITASPLWLRLVDTYTGAPPGGPVTVLVQRSDGASWQSIEPKYVLTRSGNLAFPGLGLRTPGAAADPYQVRVTIHTPRSIAEAATGVEYLQATITPWTDAPPPPNADVVSFYPGPDYPYAAAIPLVAGSVTDAVGDPVPGAAVTSTESVATSVRTEEARTASDGTFRLSLRWSAGSTQVTASSNGSTTSLTIDVPADLVSALHFVLT